MVRTDLDDDESFSDSEVRYYTRDYVDVPDAPLIRCHNAVYSAADHAYHLLLDDVSATHVEATRRPPTVEYALALADGLAAMHARWWGADRLAAAGRPIHDAGQVQHFVDIAAPGDPHVLERCTTELAGHWPGMIRQVIARHPGAMIERTRTADGFTIIQGDPGCTNILVPRAGSRPPSLIDRQPFNWSLTTWLGIYDLVYATVLDWPVTDRRRLEKPLLRRYHDQLLAHGVDGYSWDQLWTDYRLMIPIGGVHRRRVQPRRSAHRSAVRLAALPAAHAHRLRRPGLLCTLVRAFCFSPNHHRLGLARPREDQQRPLAGTGARLRRYQM